MVLLGIAQVFTAMAFGEERRLGLYLFIQCFYLVELDVADIPAEATVRFSKNATKPDHK